MKLITSIRINILLTVLLCLTLVFVLHERDVIDNQKEIIQNLVHSELKMSDQLHDFRMLAQRCVNFL